MPSIHNPPTLDARTAGLRRLAHAALLAGAGAFGHSAIASAE